MNLSRVGLLLVMVVILSLGWQAKPSEATEDNCHRPELLYPYLEIDRYNESYPYVDYEAVVKPVLDYMLKRVPGVMESSHDLFFYWNEVCMATDPEKEVAAWRNLAQELNHRMHSDESVYKIAKILFGDQKGAWLMDPPIAMLVGASKTARQCFYRVSKIFTEHCGMVGDGYGMKHGMLLTGMCVEGMKEDEFADAVFETCKDCVHSKSTMGGTILNRYVKSVTLSDLLLPTDFKILEETIYDLERKHCRSTEVRLLLS